MLLLNSLFYLETYFFVPTDCRLIKADKYRLHNKLECPNHKDGALLASTI